MTYTHCSNCGRPFKSLPIFDAHRVAEGEGRRCLTDSEMRRDGWRRVSGAWEWAERKDVAKVPPFVIDDFFVQESEPLGGVVIPDNRPSARAQSLRARDLPIGSAREEDFMDALPERDLEPRHPSREVHIYPPSKVTRCDACDGIIDPLTALCRCSSL